MEALLQQIAQRGAAAYAVRARELLRELTAAPEAVEIRSAAEALIDAFLNDPYLVRNRTA